MLTVPTLLKQKTGILTILIMDLINLARRLKSELTEGQIMEQDQILSRPIFLGGMIKNITTGGRSSDGHAETLRPLDYGKMVTTSTW